MRPEMQLIAHRAKQHSHEHYGSALDAHDLRDRGIRIFVAHDHESPRRQLHA